MKSRILKEFRLLAFPWVLALLVIPLLYGFNEFRRTVPPWDVHSYMYHFATWYLVEEVAFIQVLAFTIMGALVFGAEYGNQTMERLLAQPVPRLQIWHEKMGLLAVLLFSCLAVDLIFCAWLFYPQFGYYWHWTTQLDAMGYATFFAFSAFSTGPLISFYTRQTHTTFWGIVVLPSIFLPFIWMGVSFLLYPIIGTYAQRIWGGGLGTIVWCVPGYFLARRKFLRLEV